MRKTIAVLVLVQLIVFSVFLSGCVAAGPKPPESFTASPAGWKTIELRPELSANYERAWQTTVDSVAKDWDIETLDKDSGYLRTAWKNTVTSHHNAWTGHHSQVQYGNRVSIKFPSSVVRDSLQLKTEAY